MSKQRPGPPTDDDGRLILSPNGDPFSAVLALWDARDALVTFASGEAWARRLKTPRPAAAFAAVCRRELKALREAGVTPRTSRAVQALADLGRAAVHVASFEDDEAGRLLGAVHGVAGYPHKLRVERARPELLPVAQRGASNAKGPSPAGGAGPKKRGRPRKDQGPPAGDNPPGASFSRPKAPPKARAAPPAARKPAAPRAPVEAPPAAPEPPPEPYTGPRGTCPGHNCPHDAAPYLQKTPEAFRVLCRPDRIQAQKWLSRHQGTVGVTPAMAVAAVTAPVGAGRVRRLRTLVVRNPA